MGTAQFGEREKKLKTKKLFLSSILENQQSCKETKIDQKQKMRGTPNLKKGPRRKRKGGQNSCLQKSNQSSLFPRFLPTNFSRKKSTAPTRAEYARIYLPPTQGEAPVFFKLKQISEQQKNKHVNHHPNENSAATREDFEPEQELLQQGRRKKKGELPIKNSPMRVRF